MVAAGVHPKVVSGRPSVTPPRVFRPGKVRPCDAGQEEAAGKINAGLGAALAGKRSAISAEMRGTLPPPFRPVLFAPPHADQ